MILFRNISLGCFLVLGNISRLEEIASIALYDLIISFLPVIHHSWEFGLKVKFVTSSFSSREQVCPPAGDGRDHTLD